MTDPMTGPQFPQENGRVPAECDTGCDAGRRFGDWLRGCGGVVDALEHAIRCGELLIEQKQAMGATHGGNRKDQVLADENLKFTDWVPANCAFSYPTANRYMKAADNKDAVLASAGRAPSGRRARRVTRRDDPPARVPPIGSVGVGGGATKNFFQRRVVLHIPATPQPTNTARAYDRVSARMHDETL